MTAQVTVTLPDDVLQQAESLAVHLGRPIEQILAETIELSLRPLGTPSLPERPVSDWSDEEVLAAADVEWDGETDERLSELLERQQAEQLTLAERGELTSLMQLYQQLLLRKARAAAEAVRRGLREPIGP